MNSIQANAAGRAVRFGSSSGTALNPGLVLRMNVHMIIRGFAKLGTFGNPLAWGRRWCLAWVATVQ